jgi:sarcosine oxidase subunit beta
MKKAEIVIIGGGVIGASVAYHLMMRGAKDVLILESESEQGSGSTGKATGGIRAQFETDINIKMSLYSLDFFVNSDFDCGYEPRGYLFFGTDENQFEYLRRNVEKQKSLGVKNVEIVDAKTISEICPGLNVADIVGGTFGARDGFINPLAVMNGFTSRAIENGAKIEFETLVFSIEIVRGKVKAVKTNKGVIECEKVVLCTGALARQLAQTAGIDLPVEPQKRQLVWARSVNEVPKNLPMVIDLGSGFHFRPARDFIDSVNSPDIPNEIFFACPDADENSSFDTNFDESFIAKVYERAKHRAAFYTKRRRFSKNAAPDCTKTRLIITRFWATAKSKACISPTVFRSRRNALACDRQSIERNYSRRQGEFFRRFLFKFGEIHKGELLHETAFI